MFHVKHNIEKSTKPKFDASKDYLGASTGSERVVKGGSWDLAADKVTVSNRSKATPSDKNITTGFRVVLPKVKR